MRLRGNREDMDVVGGGRNDVTIAVIMEILKNKINVKGFHCVYILSHLFFHSPILDHLGCSIIDLLLTVLP